MFYISLFVMKLVLFFSIRVRIEFLEERFELRVVSVKALEISCVVWSTYQWQKERFVV